jgi:dTDP-4-amino-4,6-dideoxygalactose transaminase
MKVPFFNYPWVYLQHEDEIREKIFDVMHRGAFILQEDLEEFEKNLCKYLNVNHAFGVADGTNALILGLMAMGIGENDEVIVPSHTYIASAASIHFSGAIPIPVECGDDHMLDPDVIVSAITPQTKAIMPVQLNGRTCNMRKIMDIADKYDLKIIEDAAQALGSKFMNQYAATFGGIGTFSFYPAKLLGTFGDGGAVITNDNDLAKKISHLRDHGRDDLGEVVAWGTNSRLDNMHAAVLDIKLKYFQEDIDKRRGIARQYQDSLGNISQIALPPAPDSNSDHFDVYQNYEILAQDRDIFQSYLGDNGVGTLVQFGGKAIHQHEELGFGNVNLPKTEKMYKSLIMLPMNTSLSENDVSYVIDVIKKFYNK